MTIDEVIKALELVKGEFEGMVMDEILPYTNNVELVKKRAPIVATETKTKGGYFLVGNVAVKIAEIVELK